MFRLGLITYVLCAVGHTVTAQAGSPAPADFYVAPWGDDAFTGAFDAPFATLARARDAVRDLIAAGLTQDVVVLVRGGSYRITQPVVFGLEDSSPDPYTVSYAAYPDEEPVISGGRVIAGWTAQGDGTWTVTIPEVLGEGWLFRELFVGGHRRQRARHPNTGFVRVAGPTSPGDLEDRMSFRFGVGDIPWNASLAGAELLFLHDWSTSRVKIDTVDHLMRILTLAEPIGAAASIFSIFATEEHPRFAIENDPALLDAPGEWYLDKQTGVLTYLPMPGEDMTAVEVVAPLAEALLVVRGDVASEQFVQNLGFDGLAFEHCAWGLLAGGYAAYQAGFYEWRDYPNPYVFPAALTFELAESCRFENGRIARVGAWGILFGQSCRNCVLTGTVISDNAGNGVMIGEDQYRIEDNVQWWLSRPDQAATGNVVSNNFIERNGEVFHGCVGVWVGLANNTTVSHNLVRYHPQIGVSVGWMWDDVPTPCSGNVIEYNHIHDSMLMLSDGGGIYTLGRQPGTVLHGNRIQNVPLDAGLSESNGIFCDQGTTDLLISDNAIFHTVRAPLRFHLAGVNTVSGNTLILGNPSVPAVRYNATDPADIVLIGNDIRMTPSPLPCDDAAYDAAPLAGLEPQYQQQIFGSADPSCGECFALPDSRLVYDACGVCGGASLPCADGGVPTLSEWGLGFMTLVVLVAGVGVLRQRR